MDGGPEGYVTIVDTVVAELEVKRSRFLCTLAPVESEAAAHAVVDELRARFRDARHHCSATILGPSGQLERASDDGEPSGTAGAPMLDALRGSGLTDVVAVVTRWFGGTLLGTGGLIRAYGEAVRLALAAADRREVRLLRLLRITSDAATAGRLEADLRGRGVEVLQTRWSERVELTVGVPPSGAAATTDLVAALSGGHALLVESGERWV